MTQDKDLPICLCPQWYNQPCWLDLCWTSVHSTDGYSCTLPAFCKTAACLLGVAGHIASAWAVAAARDHNSYPSQSRETKKAVGTRFGGPLQNFRNRMAPFLLMMLISSRSEISHMYTCCCDHGQPRPPALLVRGALQTYLEGAV